MTIGRALQGLKILDLTQYIPGPLACLWLADMGGDVVKVEPPNGDPMERMGALDKDGRSYFYKMVNRNKRVVRLNLKDAKDQAIFADWLANADVLVEAYRPGVLDRLGFDKDRLAQINPRLIHCSLSGYGQTGPWAKIAGHDVTYVSLTGALDVSGPRSRPQITFPPMADHAGAANVVTGVLAALLTRSTTGRGCHLDISLSESLLGWMGGVLTSAHRGEDIRREQLDINGGAAWYNIYETADGRFLAFAPMEEKFWSQFCNAVDRPDWINRQFEPLPQSDLIDQLTALFKTQSLGQWMDLLRPLDSCVEPVLSPAEALHHPQWQARGNFAIGRDVDNVVDVALGIRMDGEMALDRVPLKPVAPDAISADWA